jgi:hypothetical protein
MAKKKKHKHYRNAAPRPPRANRAGADTPSQHLGYTAAGAAGSAVLVGLLARQGWAPKTVAGAVAAVGAGLGWKGDGSTIRSVGAGAMSGAGAQLALMMIADHEHQQATTTKPATTTASTTVPLRKPANAELPPGVLEAAFYRARDRLAATAGEELQAA